MTNTTDIAERLALSRERMRHALQGRSPNRTSAAADSAAGRTALPWLTGLKALPIAGIVIDALSGWWAQHPLRIALVVGSSAAKSLAEPIAQRNPLGLVLGTAVLGAVVVWSRPWRWLLKPALFAGLLPQLLHKALAQLPVHALAPAPPAPPVQAPHALAQPSAN